MLPPRGEGHLLVGPDEVPALLGGVDIAHHLDVAHVAAAQAELVGEADVPDRERIEAHQLRRHGVDGDLIGARQQHVLDVGNHAARAGAVAREGPVHHREDSAVDLLLDHQQVHERVVNHRMRPVAPLVQKTAEGILHRAGGGGEDVGLHGGKMNDVLADEAPRNVEAVGVDLVEAQEPVREVADGVADVDPFLAFVEVDVAKPVRLHHRELLVLPLGEVSVDDDGAVVAGVDQVRIVAVRLHGADHALELPGRRRAGGEEEVPGDVHLECGVDILGQDVLVAGQVHQPVVVRQDRPR